MWLSDVTIFKTHYLLFDLDIHIGLLQIEKYFVTIVIALQTLH